MTFYKIYVIIHSIPIGKFIIESVITISRKIKNLFRSIKNKICSKTFWSILLLLIILIQVGIYSYGYYKNNNLSFTQEDKFIFIFLIFTIVMLCLLFVYVLFEHQKFYKILHKIYTAILDSEENFVEIERDTQDLIITIFKKGK